MKIAMSLLTCGLIGLTAAGCGSSRRSGSTPGTATGAASTSSAGTTQGLPGSYLGTYVSGSGRTDHGRVGVMVFPDLSFSAIAVSELDEDVRESFQGALAPDGTVRSVVSYGGTAFTCDLARLTGSYAGNASAGTFVLHRAAPGGTAGCYGGTTTNVTLGITGQWMGIVDEQQRLFALYYYPYPVPYLSEGVQGTVTPDGAGGHAISAGNASNTITGTGTLVNGWISGAWSSPGQGQSGTWTGTRAP